MAKILLVDDDPDILVSFSALLRPKRHEPLTANNKKAAFEILNNEKIDLVLLDINMTTDQEGLDMAIEMLENPVYKEIPIIIITGIEVMTGNLSVVELAREMRLDPAFQNLKVILVKDQEGNTALDFKSEEKGRSVNLPLAGFLRKPVEPEKLWSEIDKILN